MARDITPQFSRPAGRGDGQRVDLTNLSAFTQTPPIGSAGEVAVIAAVAILVVGGIECSLRWFEVPLYILPPPSAVALALVSDFHLILPHLGHTLVELLAGFAIGAGAGLLLAALVTQFPFAEKVIAPYILLLVTTPMLALVPLLILRFGFGYEPRIIAVALASGPMVMINAATGFRRVDSAKIALARAYGASTVQIFWKIRAPMMASGTASRQMSMTTHGSAPRLVSRWFVILARRQRTVSTTPARPS